MRASLHHVISVMYVVCAAPALADAHRPSDVARSMGDAGVARADGVR